MSEDKNKLKWSKVFLIGFCSLVLMLLIYVLSIKEVGQDRYAALISWINSHFSLRLGMFLYAYLVDTLILPISPDLVWVIGAGMAWHEAILIVGLGSALGGISSYGIGLFADRIPVVRRFADSANKKWGPYINAYGVPLIVVSAIFPLPFSTLCTVAGVMGLSFKKVALASTLRLLHAAIYYALFRAGLLLI